MRIDVSDYYELRDWSEKFSVSEERLKEAVRGGGRLVANVERHLTSWSLA